MGHRWVMTEFTGILFSEFSQKYALGGTNSEIC